MNGSSFERFHIFMAILDQRNQAMLGTAALVLVGMMWYELLAGRPRLRRWLAWICVVLYNAVMVVMVLLPPPPTPI